MPAKKQPISVENANQLATHLKAILDHEQAPEILKRDVREAVNNLFNTDGTDTDAISDSFFNIRNTVLAHGNNGAGIAELEAVRAAPGELRRPTNDLAEVANALSILMTSNKTPHSIHDAVVDRLSDLEAACASKNINEYSPAHLAEVLALELENEQKQTNDTETATKAEDASKTTCEAIMSEDLDVFARVLSKILKDECVSDEIRTHFGDALTQIETDWRNETIDYESEDFIKQAMRGYFVCEEATDAGN